jgi:hypothetical protein
MNCTETARKFLCVEDDLGNISGRCKVQCAECRDLEEHEASGIPPEDDGEDTNVEDSYAR